ncbi:MAG: prephenate dehydrogenase/arogenate dehydrogenase family protein [Fimbriimonadales bacterium]
MQRVNFGTVGIVGMGLIGASIGLRLREKGVCKRVLGFDTDPQMRLDAHSVGAVHDTFDTLNHLGDADILILAVPPNAIIPCLIEADVFCKVNCIVTDTSSVKSKIVDWIASYPLQFGPRFVGGHPMAGTQHKGASHANAALFEDKPWVLTPTESTDKSALNAIQSLVTVLGAKPTVLSPEEHDRHAAILSHLPNILAAGLVQMGSNLVHPEVAGPSWKDLTRVAGSDPQLWAQILSNNREQVVSALEDLEFLLQEVRQFIDREQYQSLLEFFESSRRAKAGWDS